MSEAVDRRSISSRRSGISALTWNTDRWFDLHHNGGFLAAGPMQILISAKTDLYNYS